MGAGDIKTQKLLESIFPVLVPKVQQQSPYQRINDAHAELLAARKAAQSVDVMATLAADSEDEVEDLPLPGPARPQPTQGTQGIQFDKYANIKVCC